MMKTILVYLALWVFHAEAQIGRIQAVPSDVSRTSRDMIEDDLTLVGGSGTWQDNENCTKIYKQVSDTLKSKKGVVDCYMQLFFKESSCRPRLGQAKGNTGNPHAGFGLCTLETSPALRKKRGKNCRNASVDNVAAQILCCRDIMRAFSKKGSYYGPVRRGEVAKCE